MKWFFFGVLLLMFGQAHAKDLIEFNQSIRAMGMGNAYIPIVKDTDALFYNPAALAKVEGLNWQVLNVRTGVNFDLVKDRESFTGISSPADYSKFFGKDVWLGVNAKSAFAMPNFGFAAYDNAHLDIQLHNPAYPQFNTSFLNDYGFVVGGAVPIGPFGSFGMTAKRISRWGGIGDIGVGSIASAGGVAAIQDAYKSKGVGYGVDMATAYTLPMPFNPSLAVVWQDVGSTSFQKTEGPDAPPRIKDNLSLGFGTSVDLPGLDVVTAFEARHLTDNDIQLGKKLHLGTEISLPLIDLRAGLNQGYTSYGVGLHVLFITIDAAYYTEEVGLYPGQTPENRAQVGVSIDLGFDANFKFTDNNGKTRRLKQRR